MTPDAKASQSRRPSDARQIPSEELASLEIAQLRTYRHRLAAEEERVSYWRRLTQARIDILEAGSRGPQPLSFADLVRVLGDTGSGLTRHALIRVKPADPLPELPDLAAMWETETDIRHSEQVETSLKALHAAERQLSEYRRALHERIDEATGELIQRYRADPSAVLAFLPRG